MNDILKDEQLVNEILEDLENTSTNENIENEVQATAFDYTDYRYLEQIISKQDTIIDNQQTIIYNQEQSMLKTEKIINISSTMVFIIFVCFLYSFIKSIFHI